MKKEWLKTEFVTIGDTRDNDIIRVTCKDGSIYFDGTRKDYIDFILKQASTKSDQNEHPNSP